MSDTETLEIELEEDKTPPTDDLVVDPASPPEKTTAAPIVTADEGIEELRRNLASETAARHDAERRAADATQRAHVAKTEVEDANLTVVRTAIDSVTRDRDAAKANFRAAIAAGDADAAADAQLALTDAVTKLSQLETGRLAMEARAKAPPRPVITDPVEALASQLTPKSAAWVRSHPQYATDPRLNQKMIAAHNLVTADGVATESDAYFDAVENLLGLRKAPEQPQEQPAPRRAAPPVAPPSRSGSMNGVRPNVVTLTAAEREIAAMSGMSDKEYAVQKRELQKAGRLN